MSSTSNSVLFNTSYGPFVVELRPDKAPATVSNFLRYVDADFYDNTLFHRVIDDFMIQGGGMNLFRQFKTPNTPISLESNNGLSNVRGSIAMARNNTPDSATSQFFINVENNPPLDYRNASNPGYAVFGSVTEGMDVVDAISSAPVVRAIIGGMLHEAFPYPQPVAVYSAARYVEAASQVPTTHTAAHDANGVKIASYAGSRFDYGIKHIGETLTVQRLDGQHLGETLTDIKRLSFADRKMAYDLTSTANAGETALFIGALAPDLLLDKRAFGTVLSVFDQGKNLAQAGQLAIDLGLVRSLAGSDSNLDLVRLLFRNIVGSEADAQTAAELAANLQGSGGTMSQAEFFAMAAALELNQQQIGLVGLQHSGIEYL